MIIYHLSINILILHLIAAKYLIFFPLGQSYLVTDTQRYAGSILATPGKYMDAFKKIRLKNVKQ